MLRRLLVLSALLVGFAAPAAAQIPVLDIRVGAQAAMPTGDFGEAYDAGVGGYFRVGVPLVMTKLVGSLTYTRFKAVNPLVDDANEWSVQVGPHFNVVPMMDLGLELGYFGESKELGFNPNVSIGVVKFDITAGFNMVFADPQATWVTVGLGVRF